MLDFINSENPLVKYGTVVLGLLLGAVAWEIFGLNSNPAFMAPLIGNAAHPGAAPRLIANFSDQEFVESLTGSAQLFATGFSIAVVKKKKRKREVVFHSVKKKLHQLML